ncbi:hypothetical protein AWB79_00696 [Caballeronia hypogeia]|uniref:3-deoxy-D-arabino-heptulosonate 7-phosphate synthase n=1 Tax=Caballeronia hypogeia TaxID=1777140 RepID=A0A157ZFD5_9BURK|nr:hypothetical protein [Caballeronia hypogeia]SAK43607.1 hypothetical protein AWB79_00696 [Caballeronia hypogeia]
MLDEILRGVTRCYRLPPLDSAAASSPAKALALALEQAREALARAGTPDEALKRRFIDSLARMIRDALRTDGGDPVFQAMTLRHRVVRVREYASLSAHAGQDRRGIRAAVASLAHPGKVARIVSVAQRDALSGLHAAATSADSSAFHETVRALLEVPEIAQDSALASGLVRLRDSDALTRLRRLESLEADESVRHYRSLCDLQGPRPGSALAVAHGAASQRRGVATEAAAARALEALARRLDEADGTRDAWRVVTSMRVPASIPASHAHAKTEWDAVLLHRVSADDEAWDVRLLVEAKASVDAAATDFGRLLRGIRLLAHAERDATYAFETRCGTMRIRGASLGALRTDEASLRRTVLYCCDAPAEANPRLLGAAIRMQLLSAPASLEYAAALAENPHADAQVLEAIWTDLLASPRWRAVLDQYPMLRQVRELMVHTNDLAAAADNAHCESGNA